MPENKRFGKRIGINDIHIVPRTYLEEAMLGARVMTESARDIARVTPATDPRIITSTYKENDVIYSAEQDVDVKTIQGRTARVTLHSFLTHTKTKDGDYGRASMRAGWLIGTRRYRD